MKTCPTCKSVVSPEFKQKESRVLTVNVSATDTELFKELFSLSLWMYMQLPKVHQEFAYKEMKSILSDKYDLSEFNDIKK